MPEQTLTIELETPFGAACALGILRAVPMPTSTSWRGPVEIIQTAGPASGIRRQAEAVMAESSRRRMDVPFSVFASLCTERGPVCTARLVGITSCSLLPEAQTLGLCSGLRPYKYAWFIVRPEMIPASLPFAEPPLELRA